jgi:hypothetical protein
MFSSTIINLCITIIISIIIISLLHYFWEYLKDTYSTKKVKDLVNTQIEKYKLLVNSNKGSQSNDFLTEEEKISMNEELENYVTSLTFQTV